MFSTAVAATAPPALAKRFSLSKAQPGLLYLHVLAQRSAVVNEPEPITLLNKPPRRPPTELLDEEDEEELLLEPPSKPPRRPVTALPVVDEEEEALLSELLLEPPSKPPRRPVTAVPTVDLEVLVEASVVVVFFVVFLTGINSDCEALSTGSLIALAFFSTAMG